MEQERRRRLPVDARRGPLGLPVQGWRSHRHQPGAHGWCRRNGPSQGDRPQGRHRYHIRSGGHRQHREFLRSALNRKSDVQRRQPSGVPHLQLGNANNGGREATLTAAYAGQEERLNWNDTAKSFYVGEGGTGTCVSRSLRHRKWAHAPRTSAVTESHRRTPVATADQGRVGQMRVRPMWKRSSRQGGAGPVRVASQRHCQVLRILRQSRCLGDCAG